MANLDPWTYASKTNSEHAEQVALFMWANMAMRFGIKAANDARCYNERGYVQHYQLNVFASRYDSKLGKSVAVPVYETIPQLKWLHAISNHGAGFGRKAEGVKAGVSDIFLPCPRYHVERNDCLSPLYCGLYIELKRQAVAGQKAGKPSDEQLEFQTDMRAAGYACALCYGWEQARDEILRYLGLTA